MGAGAIAALSFIAGIAYLVIQNRLLRNRALIAKQGKEDAEAKLDVPLLSDAERTELVGDAINRYTKN